MLQNKWKNRLAAILVCGLAVTAPLVAYAEDEDLQQQIDSYQQQIQEQQGVKADAEKRIGQQTTNLEQAEQELKKAQDELAAIQGQRKAVEGDIAVTQKKLDEAQKRLAKREVVFQKRVRDIYINGRLSYLEVVLGSKDFNDFANRVQVLKRIIDADIKLINGIKEERADIASQKDKLEADRAKIVDLEKQAQAKQAEIEQRKQTYAQLLAKARTDQAGSIEKIQELEAASQQVRPSGSWWRWRL